MKSNVFTANKSMKERYISILWYYSANCPKRLIVQRKATIKEKQTQNRTYAEMLREAGDQMPGEDPSRYLEKPFDTNTRNRKLTKSTTPVNKKVFTKKPKTGNETKDSGSPPGLQKAAIHPNDEIHKFLLKFVKELNLQPFVSQIIVKFIVPIVHQLISSITNTVMEKISNNTQ